jgi:hypothetical protein
MRIRALASGFVFIILASGCSGPAATSGPTAAPSPAAHTISGRIGYTGSALAGHKIVVVVGRAGEQGSPAYSIVISGPGSYTVSDVADGSYDVFAFGDLGDDMGAPKADEPQGWFDADTDGTPDLVVIQDGTPATGVDFTIVDR